MNAERPLFAFILVVVRRTLSPDELLQNHDCRRQIAAVQLYAHSSGRTISRILRVQTTYRGTIFYRSVGFRSAVLLTIWPSATPRSLRSARSCGLPCSAAVTA